jgi:hypothetical protein
MFHTGHHPRQPCPCFLRSSSDDNRNPSSHTSGIGSASVANSIGCDLATVEDCGSNSVPLQVNGMRV